MQWLPVEKNFKQDCFRVVYHYHRGRIFGLFCVLKFSLVRWLSNVFLLSQIVVCCLRLSFVVSYCRQQVTIFPLIPNILSCITFAVESSNMLSDFRFKSNF